VPALAPGQVDRALTLLNTERLRKRAREMGVKCDDDTDRPTLLLLAQKAIDRGGARKRRL
jgi:hypothetical protein